MPRWLPHLVVIDSPHAKRAVDKVCSFLGPDQWHALVACGPAEDEIRQAFEQLRSMRFEGELHNAGWEVDGVHQLLFVHVRELPEDGNKPAPHPTIDLLRKDISIVPVEIWLALRSDDYSYVHALQELAARRDDSRHYLLSRHNSTGQIFDEPTIEGLLALFIRLVLFSEQLPEMQHASALPHPNPLLEPSVGTVSLLGACRVVFPSQDELAQRLGAALVEHSRGHLENGFAETAPLRDGLFTLVGEFEKEIRNILARAFSSSSDAEHALGGARAAFEEDLGNIVRDALAAPEGKHLQLDRLRHLIADLQARLERLRESVIEHNAPAEAGPSWLCRLFGKKPEPIGEPRIAIAGLVRQTIGEVCQARAIWLSGLSPTTDITPQLDGTTLFATPRDPLGASVELHSFPVETVRAIFDEDLQSGSLAIARRVADNLAGGRPAFDGIEQQATSRFRSRLQSAGSIPAVCMRLLPDLASKVTAELERVRLSGHPLPGMDQQRTLVWYGDRTQEIIGENQRPGHDLQGRFAQLAVDLHAGSTHYIVHESRAVGELGLLLVAHGIDPTHLQPYANQQRELAG